MDELAGCYQLAGCDQQTENQNITAYGIIFFVIHLLSSTLLLVGKMEWKWSECLIYVYRVVSL